MKSAAILLQWGQILFAALSVVLWFRSAWTFPRETSDSNPPGGKGDLMIGFEEGVSTVYNFREQGRLNAAAAGCTGVVVLLQLIALLFVSQD